MTDIRNDNPSGFSLDLGDTFGGTDGGFGTSPSLGHDSYEPSASGGFGSLFDSNTKPPATFDLGFEFDADFGTDFGANAENLWNTGSDFSYGDPFGADWSLDRSPYDFGTSNLHEEPREFDLGWDFGWDIGTTEDQELGLGLDDFEWNWDAPGFDTEPAEFSLWGGLPQQDDAWPEASVDFGGFSFTNDFEAGGDFNLDDAAWFHGLGEAGVESSWAPVFRDPALEPNPDAPGFQLTIEQGDSLSALAQSLGVTVDDLLAVNPDITRESVLQIGQTLAVPAWTHGETVNVRGHANAYTAAERIHAALESSGTEMAKVVEIRKAIASAGPGEGPALIEALRKMALDEELMTSLDPRYRELVQEQIHNLGGSTIEYLEPVLEQVGYGYVEGMAEGGVEAVEAFKSLFRAQTWKDLGALGTTVVKATNLGVGVVDPEAQSDAQAELLLGAQMAWETLRDGWQEAKRTGTTARYMSEAAGRVTFDAFASAAGGAGASVAKQSVRAGLSAARATALGRVFDLAPSHNAARLRDIASSASPDELARLSAELDGLMLGQISWSEVSSLTREVRSLGDQRSLDRLAYRAANEGLEWRLDARWKPILSPRPVGDLDPSVIRDWYNRQAGSVERLNHDWLASGLGVEERAFRAWTVRHQARLEARAMMGSARDVLLLQHRDLFHHGYSDGPSFAELVGKYLDAGHSPQEAYERIIGTSSKTNAAVTKKVS